MKKRRLLFAGCGLALCAALTMSCSNENKSKDDASADYDATEKIAEKHAAESSEAKQEEAALTEEMEIKTEKNDEAAQAKEVEYNAAFFNSPANKAPKAGVDKYAETATGLKYVIVKEGKGKQPGPTSEVTVHYTGKLLDGTVFDSSVTRGEPATFPLNRVIPGWTEGLQLMREGGRAIFYIPSNLAYGPNGIPGVIPPDSPLIFEVELFEVK